MPARIFAGILGLQRAIRVGGIALPASSCLWHVVDLGTFAKGLRAGAGLASRRVSQEAASGILLQALQKSFP